jgi:hypothetical protein
MADVEHIFWSCLMARLINIRLGCTCSSGTNSRFFMTRSSVMYNNNAVKLSRSFRYASWPDSLLLYWTVHPRQGQTLQHFSVQSNSTILQRVNNNCAQFDREEVEEYRSAWWNEWLPNIRLGCTSSAGTNTPAFFCPKKYCYIAKGKQ